MPGIGLNPSGCCCGSTCDCGEFPCPDVVGQDLAATLYRIAGPGSGVPIGTIIVDATGVMVYSTADGCPRWVWNRGGGVVYSLEPRPGVSSCSWKLVYTEAGGETILFVVTSSDCDPFKIDAINGSQHVLVTL